jgi:hypothetical protein
MTQFEMMTSTELSGSGTFSISPFRNSTFVTLAYLRRAGIVSARRQGKWMRYSIVVPKHAGATRILRETLSALRTDKTMLADIARLDKACCVPQKQFALEGAPLPTPVEALDSYPGFVRLLK